ncbi:hypothetical protein D3C84_422020 [compost metagenome]
MSFSDAKKRATIKFYVGALITIPALASTVISMLKMFYFNLDDGTALAGRLVGAIRSFVGLIYEHTSLLKPLWIYSPTPDFTQFTSTENIKFFIIYLLIFVGFAFIASAKKLFKRLQVIRERIEDQLISESIKGAVARSREEIEASVQMPRSSIFSQAHSLYLAPLATTIIGALVLKLLFGIG